MGIFRRYDIRGVYKKDLDEGIMRKIGTGFSRVAKDKKVVISQDTRLSSLSLKNAFVSGMSGKKLIDAGILPISAALFAAWKNNAALAYVTASHLPKEWNGIKFYHSSMLGFSAEEVQEIGKLCQKNTSGSRCDKSIVSNVDEDYAEFLSSKINAERPLRVLIDCGNGATSVGVKNVFEKAGFSVDAMFDVPDGNFPNRPSDPLTDELAALKSKVYDYDFGLAFDGDGDRVMVVDDKGRKLTCEQMGYISLHELLNERKGDVAANVECSMLIDMAAKKFGRNVIRFPVGHTFLSQTVQRHKVAYGTEINGHGAIPHLAPFNDSVAMALYFGYALSKQNKKLSEIVNKIPALHILRKYFECPDDKKFAVIENLKKNLKKVHKDVDTMDGVRVNLGDSWVLIRASNTEPTVRMHAEAKTKVKAQKLIEEFGAAVEKEIGRVESK
ncbi:MAG: hypothetical protein HYW25_02625 [Candidatus Aenigmarchaeota archaeon]|nr:hypothetical protein [Candidatus Aenigmarchaeota archaeon]